MKNYDYQSVGIAIAQCVSDTQKRSKIAPPVGQARSSATRFGWSHEEVIRQVYSVVDGGDIMEEQLQLVTDKTMLMRDYLPDRQRRYWKRDYLNSTVNEVLKGIRKHKREKNER